MASNDFPCISNDILLIMIFENILFQNILIQNPSRVFDFQSLLRKHGLALIGTYKTMWKFET